MKMDVVKLLEFGEGFVRWVAVEGRNEEDLRELSDQRSGIV